MSKTIFITSFHVLISRNILSTAIIPILQWGGVRIVVLVPEYKKDYFEKHFAGSNIIIEGIPANQPSQRLFGLMFKRLFQMMLPTRSIRILQGYRIYLGKGRWYRLFYGLAQFLGRRLWVIRMARFLDFHLSPRGTFRAPLEHYRPDIVFSTDVQNENDVVLMHDARRRRIPIVGMVRSWDNLTVLGLIRFLPDRLLATSETMRAEAVRYNGMSPERITVAGIPHYDRY
ncbi:MAG: glycosyltransferase, partial [Candidatus Sungbacteria bacterium]|nr:glycosyltransferase [Candidatus Sungbacteria bacterium]